MTRKQKLGWTVVSSYFGIIFILLGFASLFSDFVSAVIALLLGAALSFPGFRLIKSKVEKKRAERLLSEQRRIAAEERLEREAEARRIAEEARLAREQAAYDFSVELSEIPCVAITPVASGKRLRSLDSMPPISLSRVSSRTKPEKLFPLVFIDLETTGLSPDKERIVEVSAIRYDAPFVATACFNTLINPQRHIPDRAYEVHGISDDDVELAPVFADIVPDLAAFVEGANLIGHNIMFDLRFLYRAGLDLSESVRYFDTVQIAKAANPEVSNHKLVTLCSHYGIYHNNAHTALSDCYATAKVFENLLADLGCIRSD